MLQEDFGLRDVNKAGANYLLNAGHADKVPAYDNRDGSQTRFTRSVMTSGYMCALVILVP